MSELLEKLEQENWLSADQARVVRIESARSERNAMLVLEDLGLLTSDLIDRCNVSTLGLEVEPEAFIPDAAALAFISEALARQYNVLAVSFDSVTSVLVLTTDSTSNVVVRDRLRRIIPGHIQLEFRRSEATDIKRTLDKCYGASHSFNDIVTELEHASVAAASQKGREQISVVRLVDSLLQDAVTRRASDIHLAPDGLTVSIRYRVDGVLKPVCCLHSCYWSAILVRIKVLSGIDIAETRVPQDGHLARLIHGQKIDFRVASFPIRVGESLVLRVLDSRRGIRSLSSLCDDAGIEKTLMALVQRPSGLVLVGGPTGSGKTTTLYALLSALDATSLNIMTLEDPVEYPMQNVRQTRVHGNAAIGFADGVRGALRQDPDVILIGEIRDKDSCLMACRAAMTGHLVLTTTHANDSISAISRLLELGAQRSVIASVLAGVVSQRLIRKSCSHCLAKKSECSVCAGVGYSGRIPLFECLSVSDDFRSQLHGNESVDELRSQARKAGMKTLFEIAQKLVRSNKTTNEEIARVLGTNDFKNI